MLADFRTDLQKFYGTWKCREEVALFISTCGTSGLGGNMKKPVWRALVT
ncbi:Protein of unknown function, partial [Gryllus bimaculatus]